MFSSNADMASSIPSRGKEGKERIAPPVQPAARKLGLEHKEAVVSVRVWEMEEVCRARLRRGS